MDNEDVIATEQPPEGEEHVQEPAEGNEHPEGEGEAMEDESEAMEDEGEPAEEVIDYSKDERKRNPRGINIFVQVLCTCATRLTR